MSIAFYMDHHVPMAITNGLRLRGVDVITAFEDNSHQLSDSDLLDRATAIERVIFTRDDDFLGEAHRRQQAGVPFAGAIFAHQLKVSIGRCVHDLELIAKAGEPEDMRNSVQHLPL